MLVPGASRFEAQGAVDGVVWQALAREGLLGVRVPRELGGFGGDTAEYARVIRTLSEGCAATAVTVAVTNMVCETLLRYGSQRLARDNVPVITSGERLGSFALSETGAGSDPSSMTTWAECKGDRWRVFGSKQWISHGDHPAVMVVWARVKGAEGPDSRLSCFLAHTPGEGFSVSKLECKMGLGASHTCALLFEGMPVVPLGDRGQGMSMALAALDGGRIGIAAQALGMADRVMGLMVRSAGGGTGGAERVLCLADSRVDVDAGEALLDQAVSLRDGGQSFGPTAAMAKLYCSEGAQRVCERGLRWFASMGGKVPEPVERAFRDVRVTRIYEGTSEIQRLVITRSLLR